MPVCGRYEKGWEKCSSLKRSARRLSSRRQGTRCVRGRTPFRTRTKTVSAMTPNHLPHAYPNRNQNDAITAAKQKEKAKQQPDSLRSY
ncbi:hypothetical protein AN958_10086 [Leucoagaricus sp. SymC.cos]|nr:hypothetical protein AN958_10086 [Leucoagaricus sp. SymC.cos]